MIFRCRVELQTESASSVMAFKDSATLICGALKQTPRNILKDCPDLSREWKCDPLQPFKTSCATSEALICTFDDPCQNWQATSCLQKRRLDYS